MHIDLNVSKIGPAPAFSPRAAYLSRFLCHACDSGRQSILAFLRIAKTLYLSVSAQFRTQSRYAVLLELL
jgi:hypothetical protein